MSSPTRDKSDERWYEEADTDRVQAQMGGQGIDADALLVTDWEEPTPPSATRRGDPQGRVWREDPTVPAFLVAPRKKRNPGPRYVPLSGPSLAMVAIFAASVGLASAAAVGWMLFW